MKTSRTTSLLTVILLHGLLLLLPVSGFTTTRRSSWTIRSPSKLLALSGDPMEMAWRHVKKPLLSIGGQGASASHGNSLRQLLQDHTAVKVKVNTKPYDNSLTTAFERLAELVVQAGAPDPPELLQAREGDRILLLGLPGTRELILQGSFPPPIESDD